MSTTLPGSFFCEICPVKVYSEAQLRHHENGRKHQKRALALAPVKLNSMGRPLRPGMFARAACRFFTRFVISFGTIQSSTAG